MKLATYKDGSRDGQLVVVSRDLSTAHYATGIANHLQQVLDDWNFLSPQLQELSQTLNHGKARHAFAFDPARCMAPLPRAYQRVCAQAYPSHHSRLATSEAVPTADADAREALLYQGSSDALLGPCDEIVCPDPGLGLDAGAGIAVISGDLDVGCSPDAGIDGIRLLMLCNEPSLRLLPPARRALGQGLASSNLAAAFGPVAVTPDELGGAWSGGKLHLNLECIRNGKRMGLVPAADGMAVHFGELLSRLCAMRPARAGGILCGGTVSHLETERGWACIAEKRALEIVERGAAATGFLQPGDTFRIDVTGQDGHSVFGAIEQAVVQPAAPVP